MSEPERTCIGCRRKAHSQELLRWVAVPQDDGEALTVALDLWGKAPGRGVWLCPLSSCLGKAIKRRAFGRGLEEPGLFVPDHGFLATQLRDGLRSRFLQRLALARRAGTVIAGESRVAQAFKSGRGQLLILAQDLSESSRQKQESNAIRKGVAVAAPELGGNELGRCLGRDYAGILLVDGKPFSDELRRMSEQWNGLEQEARRSS